MICERAKGITHVIPSTLDDSRSLFSVRGCNKDGFGNLCYLITIHYNCVFQTCFQAVIRLYECITSSAVFSDQTAPKIFLHVNCIYRINKNHSRNSLNCVPLQTDSSKYKCM